jgi:hypothetical protein
MIMDPRPAWEYSTDMHGVITLSLEYTLITGRRRMQTGIFL